MNKKDKIVITLSMLYPLLLILVFALASPLSFYIYIVLGIALCIYWAARFIKGETGFSNKGTTNSHTLQGEELSSYSVVDELLKWNNLKDKGAITEAEYQQQKAKLLDGDK